MKISKFCTATIVKNMSNRLLSSSSRIGIVGLGNVGKALAYNLSNTEMKLHAACDIQPAAMKSLPESVNKVETPREVAESCDVILTALPTPAAVKNAMMGEYGVLAGIKKGSVWIDHSTTGSILYGLRHPHSFFVNFSENCDNSCHTYTYFVL